MKTFQEIYDFCLLDRTYNTYYDVPDHFKCKSKEEYRYYHAYINNRGQSRAGTYLYCQAENQLDRYIGGIVQDYYFHIDEETYEVVNYQTFSGKTIYIVAHIRKHGVQIEFNNPYAHPFEEDRVWFTARSHCNYDEQGLIKEVKKHFETKLLYPPGRYHDLQVEHQVPKSKFIKWYKNYKHRQEQQAEQEHWEMIEAFSPQPETLDYNQAYNLLNNFGLFHDFGYEDEEERANLTDDFMIMCNK